MRLQSKMILIICTLLFFVISILGGIFEYIGYSTIKEQIGNRALVVAQTVASIPTIRSAFDEDQPSTKIQPITEEIRLKTGAEFIVVGNREGVRYSHPFPERIGQEMVGGDNGPVLEGKSIISEAVGSLGPSLRGKTPIFNNQGKVIGIVSVGFLMEDINVITDNYKNQIILIGFFTLLFGIIGAILIANTVKRAILGLEPQEIAALYEEKRAILESIREGIIAINAKGIVTMVNHAAINLLELKQAKTITGQHIFNILPSSRLLEVIRNGKAEFDQQMWFDENELIVNRIPIYNRQKQVIGAVSSFRNKSEIFKLGQELSQVKRYAEALRAQTHEFSNKLYMISGLIQLESYQEAIEAISRESDIHQNLVHFIMEEFPDPIIGGLLIGKFNRAQELKVQLEIDRESSFRDVSAELDRDLLVTIIGNIIDNAMDAVLEHSEQPYKMVKVFFTDLGDDLIIECEDNGIGIPDEHSDKLYDLGFSTKKNEGRGFGLFLVKRAITKLNGYVTIARNSSGGTIFTVAIPKPKALNVRGDI
jgi:two-component system CitB family sensor kinase